MQELLNKLNLDTKQIIGIVGFIVVLAAIPLSFTLVKRTQTLESQASNASKEQMYSLEDILKKPNESTSPQEVPQNSPLADLKKLIESSPSASPSKSTTSTPTPTPEVTLSFGPTLTIKLNLEGRAEDDQAAKVFIGIASGTAKTRPTYLLTYSIDLPSSGTFKELSLAGLNPGSTYTAYIKGPAHIDTASTFTMSPTKSILNSSQAVTILAGDLNDDNLINSSDYNIGRAAYGSTSKSLTWNSKADFNNDGVVNNFDLAYITKNLNKTGASGSWLSSPPLTATPSALLQTTPAVQGGYWLWIPSTPSN